MRMSKHAFLFLLAAALAAGCKSTPENSATRARQDEIVALRLNNAKAETKEAAQAIEDYAYARKAEFVARMKEELVAIQEELDRLAAKADSSAGAVKAEAQTRLEAAREKFAQTKKSLEEEENATDSTWDDVKIGFLESYAGLKGSVETARQWLGAKIAP
jgi:hypothetical protein